MSYRVIEIIDVQNIIINYGLLNDAEKGDKLRVYSIGEDVIDPESNERIGTLDMIKDTVEVYIPYENFSICRKIKKRTSSLLYPLSDLTYTNTQYVDIFVNKEETSNRIIPKKEPISVGDFAELI